MGRSLAAAKNRGRGAETWAVRLLRDTHWPSAERRRQTGARDQGDINCGNKRLCIEVKAGASPEFTAFLREVEAERVNAGAEFGVVVYQPPGLGYKNVERWWGAMTTDTFNRLSKEAGQEAMGWCDLLEIHTWKSLDIKAWLAHANGSFHGGIEVVSRGQDKPNWVIMEFGHMIDLLYDAGLSGR